MDDITPTLGSGGTGTASTQSVLDDSDRPDQTAAMHTAPPAAAWYDVPVARRRDDHKVGGVLAGICRAHGFDIRTTRIAFAVVALILPVFVLAYLAAWVLLPIDPEPAVSPRQLVTERQRRPLIVAFGVLLAAVLLGSVGSWWLVGDFPWGLGLIAAGVLLWLLSNRRSGDAPTAVPPAPTTPTTPTTEAPATTTTAVSAMPGAGGDPAARAPIAPIAPVRRRIPIASITLVGVALFGVIAQVGENLGWWSIEAGAAIIASLAVLIGATIVSATVNRSRVLIAAVLALSAALATFAIADPDLDGQEGERRIRLTTDSETAVQWKQAAGVLSLDLRQLDLTADDTDLTTIAATVGVGQLEIIVRDDVSIELDASVNIGHIVVFNDEVAAGTRVRYDERFPAGAEAAAGTVRLDLEVGVGEITIVRTDTDR